MNEPTQQASAQQMLDLIYSVAIEAVVSGKRTLTAQAAYVELSRMLAPQPASRGEEDEGHA